MPTLYSANLSPYAARVRMAMYLKELEGEITIELPPGGGLKSPEYLALNPLGKIPALRLDDGFCLPESELIVEYLEDHFPARPLRPADPAGAARARLIARLCDLYLAPGLGPLFSNANPATRDAAKVDAAYATLTGALNTIERYLDEIGPWSLGDSPTTADCALGTVLWFLDWSDTVYGQSVMTDYPRCARVHASMKQSEVGARVYEEIAAGLKAFMNR